LCRMPPSEVNRSVKCRRSRHGDALEGFQVSNQL
jgi:hypothetical protein